MTLILSATALNTPTATDGIPAQRTADSTAYYIPLGKIFYPTITERTTFSRTDITINTPVMTILGTTTDLLASPPTTLRLQNTGDTVGGSDYQNEVHLSLKAGTTTDHRRYIVWDDYSGSRKWDMGVNASNIFILYNIDTVHRLWFEPDGTSYINSSGTEPVYINYHGSDTVGTGGLRVHPGGAPGDNSTALLIADGTNGVRVQNEDFAVDQLGDNDTNIILDGGLTASQDQWIWFRDRGSNKFALFRHNLNYFAAYDSAAAAYIWSWDPTNKYFGIGHTIISAPAATLHPKANTALTNTVSDVVIVAHSTSGTPAAGFGAAIKFHAEDATVDNRFLGRLYYSWVDATDAGRASQGFLTAYYTTTERTAFNWQANASEALIGFYGVAPIARAVLATGVGATVDNVITALQNLGLVKQS